MADTGRPTGYSAEILDKVRTYIEECEALTKLPNEGKGYESYEYRLRVRLPSVEGLSVYLKVARSLVYTWDQMLTEVQQDALTGTGSKSATDMLSTKPVQSLSPTIRANLLSHLAQIRQSSRLCCEGGLGKSKATAKKSKAPKSSKPPKTEEPAQFAFGFLNDGHVPSASSIVIAAPSEPVLQGEVTLPSEIVAETATAIPHEQPVTVASEPLSPPLSSGALEHAYFLQQSAKYEDRLLKAVYALIFCEILSIFTKGGINVSAKALENFGVATDNLRLMAGIFGAAAILAAGTVLYFLLRSREYVPQGELFSIRRRPYLGIAANVLMTAGAILLTVGFIIAVWQTFWDMVFLFEWIRDHMFNVLDGWDPKTSRK